VDPAQEVAHEAEVTLEVAISRFDGGATAEAFSGLTLGVVGGIGFWGRGDQQFGLDYAVEVQGSALFGRWGGFFVRQGPGFFQLRRSCADPLVQFGVTGA
jgi:hypothetical protein